MTLPLNPLHLAIALRPYVQTEPSALAFWFMINLASLAFEFNQWTQRRIEATNTDNGSFRLLLVGAAAGLAWLVAAASIVPAATIRPTTIAFAIGMAMFLGGFGLRRWSEMTLGRYFTFAVMTSTDQPVIASGPYRFVRHPGYTGVLLIVIGSGLVNGNWVGLVGWTLLVALPLLYRIHVEENALLSTLGDRYRAYATHHKRLLPLVW
jgi:protein-S-isoprenylcysteine O-methyltransferase Ste14